jgi:hypothetical protein
VFTVMVLFFEVTVGEPTLLPFSTTIEVDETFFKVTVAGVSVEVFAIAM